MGHLQKALAFQDSELASKALIVDQADGYGATCDLEYKRGVAELESTQHGIQQARAALHAAQEQEVLAREQQLEFQAKKERRDEKQELLQTISQEVERILRAEGSLQSIDQRVASKRAEVAKLRAQEGGPARVASPALDEDEDDDEDDMLRTVMSFTNLHRKKQLYMAEAELMALERILEEAGAGGSMDGSSVVRKLKENIDKVSARSSELQRNIVTAHAKVEAERAKQAEAQDLITKLSSGSMSAEGLEVQLDECQSKAAQRTHAAQAAFRAAQKEQQHATDQLSAAQTTLRDLERRNAEAAVASASLSNQVDDLSARVDIARQAVLGALKSEQLPGQVKTLEQAVGVSGTSLRELRAQLLQARERRAELLDELLELLNRK